MVLTWTGPPSDKPPDVGLGIDSNSGDQAGKQIHYLIQSGPFILLYDTAGKRLSYVFAGDELIGYK